MGRHYPLIVSGNTIREIPPTDTIYESNLVDFSSITVSGNATVSGDLTVSTNLGLSGNLLVSGDVTGKNAYFHESLNVSGDFEVSGDITGKNADFHESLNVSGDIETSGTLYAKGAEFHDDVYFSGNIIRQSLGIVSASGGGSLNCDDLSGPVMPFMWLNMVANGTTNSSNTPFGHGTQVVGVCSQDHFGWLDADKRFEVSSIGVYEILLNASITSTASQTVVLDLDLGGVTVYSTDVQIHTLTDPNFVTLLWVGLIRPTQYVHINRNAGSNLTFDKNSSLLVRRLA